MNTDRGRSTHVASRVLALALIALVAMVACGTRPQVAIAGEERLGGLDLPSYLPPTLQGAPTLAHELEVQSTDESFDDVYAVYTFTEQDVRLGGLARRLPARQLTFVRSPEGRPVVATASDKVYPVVDESDHPWSNHFYSQDDRVAGYKYVTSVVVDDSVRGHLAPVEMMAWFGNGSTSQYSAVLTITGLENIDTSNVTNMLYLFGNNSELKALDLSAWDASKVEQVHHMFRATYSLMSLSWPQHLGDSVTSMSEMFYFGQGGVMNHLDFHALNTSNVTNFSNMLDSQQKASHRTINDPATRVEELDLSGIDFTHAEEMQNLLNRQLYLTKINFGNFNAPNCTNASGMFNLQSRVGGLSEIVLGEGFSFEMADGRTMPLQTSIWYYAGGPHEGEPKVWDQTGQRPILYTTDRLKAEWDGSRMAGTWRVVTETSLDGWYAEYATIDGVNTLTFKPTADGTIPESTADVGRYAVPLWSTSAPSVPWHDVCKAGGLQRVVIGEPLEGGRKFNPVCMRSWFYEAYSLESVEGLGNLDSSGLQSLELTFDNCTSLTSLDFTDVFEGQSLVTINGTFKGCSELTSLGLGNMQASQCTVSTGFLAETPSLAQLKLGLRFSFDLASDMTVPVPDRLVWQQTTSASGSPVTGSFTTADLVRAWDGLTMAGTWQTCSTGTEGWYAAYASGAGSLEAVGNGCTPAQDVAAGTLAFVYSPGGIPLFKATGSSDYAPATDAWPVPSNAQGAKDVPWKSAALGLNKCKTVRVFAGASGQKMVPFSMSNWFDGGASIASVEGLGNIDTSHVRNMSSTFMSMATGAGVRLTLDLSSWNTGDVETMEQMFYGSTGVTAISVGEGFASTNLRSAYRMFGFCNSLQTVALPGTFTCAKVETFEEMFAGCNTLNSVAFPSTFSTERATSMERMFSGCSSLGSVSLPASVSTANVQSFASMFDSCQALTEVELPDSLDLSAATKINNMFSGCSSLNMNPFKNGSYQVCEGADAHNLFAGATSMSTAAVTECLGHLDLSHASVLSDLFYGCRGLTGNLVLPATFTCEQATDISGMFHSATNVEGIVFPNGFTAQSVTDMHSLFYSASSLRRINFGNLHASQCDEVDDMFGSCDMLEELTLGSGFTFACAADTSLPLSENKLWTQRTSAVDDPVVGTFSTTELKGMWDGATMAGTWAVTTSGTDGWYAVYCDENGMIHGQGDDESRITYVKARDLVFIRSPGGVPRFEPTEGSGGWDDARYAWRVPAFSAGIEDIPWRDVALGEDKAKTVRILVSTHGSQAQYKLAPASMNSWFDGGSSISGFADLQNIDTSKVRDMTRTFAGIATQEGVSLDLDLSSLATPSVQSMEQMFCGSTGISSITFGNEPSSALSSASLTNVSSMFDGCSSLKSVRFPSSFTCEHVTTGFRWFANCSNLTGVRFPERFDLTSVTTLEKAFMGCSGLSSLEFPTGCTAPALRNLTDMFNGCEKLGSAGFPDSMKLTQVTTLYRAFCNCKELTRFAFPAGSDLSHVANAFETFRHCEKLDANPFANGTYAFRDGTNLFCCMADCYSLSSAKAQDILEHLDLRGATNLQGLFYNCTGLTGDLELPEVFTCEGAENMSGMFQQCSNLEGVRFPRGFAGPRVTTASYLFDGCTSLKRVDLGNMNMPKCSNTSNLFGGVGSLEQITLGPSFSFACGRTTVPLPATPASWRYAARSSSEVWADSEGSGGAYPLGTVLSREALASQWDGTSMGGTWSLYTDAPSAITINYHVYDGTEQRLVLTQSASAAGTSVALSGDVSFSYPAGVHLTGWTIDDSLPDIGPSMTPVAPTYELGQTVQAQTSMDLYGTFGISQYTVEDPTTVTYDGTDKRPWLEILGPNDQELNPNVDVAVTWTDESGEPVSEIVHSGTYAADVTPREDGAYRYATPQRVYFEVEPVANAWEEGPSINGWTEGETPSTPVARALYGEVGIAYRKAGSTGSWSADQPRTRGSYVMRASVKAGQDYAGLEAEVPFTVAAPAPKPTPTESQQMFRLYNANSGEHFYTSNAHERDVLKAAGWTYEGVAWTAPVKGAPVYRLYNERGGEHHFTVSAYERSVLLGLGWKDEGVGWRSAERTGRPLYRQYNPNQFANNHNYTASTHERDTLLSLGWRDEGIAWYGV